MMPKVLTVRIDDELDRRIRRQAEAEEIPVSEFVRSTLERALDEAPQPSLYESVKPYLGKYRSGRSDLSSRRKEIVRERILAKHNRR